MKQQNTDRQTHDLSIMFPLYELNGGGKVKKRREETVTTIQQHALNRQVWFAE
jgi:hypothetical protein